MKRLILSVACVFSFLSYGFAAGDESRIIGSWTLVAMWTGGELVPIPKGDGVAASWVFYKDGRLILTLGMDGKIKETKQKWALKNSKMEITDTEGAFVNKTTVVEYLFGETDDQLTLKESEDTIVYLQKAMEFKK